MDSLSTKNILYDASVQYKEEGIPFNQKVEFNVIARLDTEIEVEYYKNDGILSFVLRNLVK
jgi:aconitate hydratase